MRICLIYDCLFPYTIGGGERWYRELGERLAADGHDVTYVTLRQWDHSERPTAGAGVRVVAAGPRMNLYVGGRRRILPPLVFGLGVLWHLLRHGRRYEVVHTCSFPFFSLLAAAALRPLGRYALVVDWFEVWTLEYWREYLGPVGGRVGWLVQRLCAAIPQQALCLAHKHARRLVAEGLRSAPLVIRRGLYGVPPDPALRRAAEPLVVFIGRLIPEKQADTVVPAVALAREEIPGLRGLILGDGPERARILEMIAGLGPEAPVAAPGFVPDGELTAALASGLCLVLPTRREGLGTVVLEAASLGVPSVVVEGPDNGATELIEPGCNGFITPSASPADLAAAFGAVHRGGQGLREQTVAWYEAHAPEMSLDAVLHAVVDSYRRGLEGGHADERSDLRS
jgi:glycosyltransferase involved in cell wall biosynthesis